MSQKKIAQKRKRERFVDFVTKIPKFILHPKNSEIKYFIGDKLGSVSKMFLLNKF